MLIVPDTNILQRDFLLSSGPFKILLDFTEKTRSEIVLSRIVYEELCSNYQTRLTEAAADMNRSSKNVKRFLTEGTYAAPPLDIAHETEKYRKYIKQRLRISDNAILDYEAGYLYEVVKRAIHREPPCSDGEQIRDAILWLSVADLAKARNTAISFISSDKSFTLDGKTLHPVLVTECISRNVMVDYFPSLDEFNRQHASSIDFITTEWIKTNLPLGDILDGTKEFVETRVTYDYSPASAEEVRRFRFLEGMLSVGSFYVYPMIDGSYRLQVTLSGRLKIECSVEKWGADWHYEYEFERGERRRGTGRVTVRPPRPRTELKDIIEHLYPLLTVVVDVVVRDKRVVSWSRLDTQLNEVGRS